MPAGDPRTSATTAGDTASGGGGGFYLGVAVVEAARTRDGVIEARFINDVNRHCCGDVAASRRASASGFLGVPGGRAFLQPSAVRLLPRPRQSPSAVAGVAVIDKPPLPLRSPSSPADASPTAMADEDQKEDRTSRAAARIQRAARHKAARRLTADTLTAQLTTASASAAAAATFEREQFTAQLVVAEAARNDALTERERISSAAAAVEAARDGALAERERVFTAATAAEAARDDAFAERERLAAELLVVEADARIERERLGFVAATAEAARNALAAERDAIAAERDTLAAQLTSRRRAEDEAVAAAITEAEGVRTAGIGVDTSDGSGRRPQLRPAAAGQCSEPPTPGYNNQAGETAGDDNGDSFRVEFDDDADLCHGDGGSACEVLTCGIPIVGDGYAAAWSVTMQDAPGNAKSKPPEWPALFGFVTRVADERTPTRVTIICYDSDEEEGGLW